MTTIKSNFFNHLYMKRYITLPSHVLIFYCCDLVTYPPASLQWYRGTSSRRQIGIAHFGETQEGHPKYYRLRCHEPTVSRRRNSNFKLWQTGLIQPLQANLSRRWKTLILNLSCPSLEGKQVRVEPLNPVPSRPLWHSHEQDRVDWLNKSLHPKLVVIEAVQQAKLTQAWIKIYQVEMDMDFG